MYIPDHRRPPSPASAAGSAAARAVRQPAAARRERHRRDLPPRALRRGRAHAVRRDAHRSGRPPRLREGHARMGRAASRRRAPGLQRDVPAHHAEGRHRPLRAAAAAAGDEPRLRCAGPRVERREPLRRRHRAGAHAAGRGLARGLLPPVRPSRRAEARQRRRGPCLRHRDVAPLQARRSLLRLPRVHALAQRAEGRARRAREALQLRPDAHPHHGRQLPARQGLGDRRPLPLRVRQPQHAAGLRLLRRDRRSLHPARRLPADARIATRRSTSSTCASTRRGSSAAA